jgi:hypothetical protein
MLSWLGPTERLYEGFQIQAYLIFTTVLSLTQVRDPPPPVLDPEISNLRKRKKKTDRKHMPSAGAVSAIKHLHPIIHGTFFHYSRHPATHMFYT